MRFNQACQVLRDVRTVIPQIRHRGDVRVVVILQAIAKIQTVNVQSVTRYTLLAFLSLLLSCPVMVSLAKGVTQFCICRTQHNDFRHVSPFFLF